MFIDHEKKILFVHNPKAAGTTTHTLLKNIFGLKGPERADPEPPIHHKPFANILAENIAAEEYYSFAIIRNPWERMLSGYLDFTTIRKTQYSGKIHLLKPLLSEFKDFKDFVMNFDKSIWKKDVHFLPQHIFTHAIKISDDENEVQKQISVNRILRVENYWPDMDDLMKTLGLFDKYQVCRHEMNHKNLNARKTKHGHYSEYYDEESKNELARIYKEDIELYGYKYEE